MYLICKGIENDIFNDRYGEHAQKPCSPPLEIHEAPEGTVSFALFMEDLDAFPVCGFSWVHWTITGLKQTCLEEGASAKPHDFIEGLHSHFGGYPTEAVKHQSIGYGSMSPPDRPHRYDIHVYALDFDPALTTGFYMNDMFHAIQGHVLTQAQIQGVYRN